MITGRVRSGTPLIALTVRGAGGHGVQIEAAIDTGFNGQLSITRELIETLNLATNIGTSCVLADGTRVRVQLFDVEVEWNGAWRPIIAASLDGGPLVGMGLLRGSHLGIDAVEGGSVEVGPIER